MSDLIRKARRDWKLWGVTAYLMLSTCWLAWTGVALCRINERLDRIDANLAAVEGIVSATDFNIGGIQKQVADITSTVDRLALRIK